MPNHKETLEVIQGIVEEHFLLPPGELQKRTRKTTHVVPKYHAMYISQCLGVPPYLIYSHYNLSNRMVYHVVKTLNEELSVNKDKERTMKLLLTRCEQMTTRDEMVRKHKAVVCACMEAGVNPPPETLAFISSHNRIIEPVLAGLDEIR